MHLAATFEAVYPFIYNLYKILRKSGTLIYNCWHLLICGAEVWFGKYPLIRGLDYLAGLNLTWPDLASSRVKEVPLQPHLLPGSCLFPIHSLHLTLFSIQSHPNTSHMLVSHLSCSARLAGLEITKLCRKTEHFRPHHPSSIIHLVVFHSFILTISILCILWRLRVFRFILFQCVFFHIYFCCTLKSIIMRWWECQI